MAPMMTEQKEIGVKATVGGVLLTAAAFDINKAYEFTRRYQHLRAGRPQGHRGLEFTATGKAIERLTVVGGLTLLDAKVNNGANDGLRAAERRIDGRQNLFGMTELPFTHGLSLTGGVYYTGEQWGNYS